jgi:single-stranded-DNA-specific exonuclease
VAVKDGLGKGSGRSIEGFHLVDALKACSGHLSRFGGHRHAVGLSLDAERLPAFAEAFAKHAGGALTDEDLVPRCKLDAWVQLQELDQAAVEGLSRLAPFGAGNPEPILACRSLEAQGRVLPSRQERRPGHLKLALAEAPALDVIGFGMEGVLQAVQGQRVDLAFNLGMDEWRGESRLSLKLRDVRAA